MAPAEILCILQGPTQALHTIDDPNSEDQADEEDSNKLEQATDMVVFFISEAILANSPQVPIKMHKCQFIAILDSGSEVNLMSERVYEKLIETGLQVPTLPVEGVVLVTAFGRRSKRIRRQALIEFSMGRDVFETIVLVAPQLNSDVILGCQFLREHGVTINFRSETFTYVRDGETREQMFAPRDTLQGACSSDNGEVPEPNKPRSRSPGQRPIHQPADCGTPHPPSRAADYCNGLLTQPTAYGREAAQGNRHGLRIEPGPLDPTRNQEFPDPDSRCSQLITRGEWAPTSEAAWNSRPRSSVTASLCATPPPELEVNSGETALLLGQPIPKPKNPSPDPRSLQEADLRSLVEQVDNLSNPERDALYQVLVRYKEHMTTRPGKCKLFTYRFQVEADKPIIGYSRPIPYALRPAVREQIQQMLADDVIEISSSPILNPLTVVRKPSGDIRICVDARRVNQFTIADHERTPPMNELLQRFHGAKFFTSLDLSSAYLQIELDEDSRKYTAFLSESTVYQYKCVPYGFRNSLPAFVRAIKLALGGSNLEGVASYVDDLLIHAPTMEDTLSDKIWKAYARIKVRADRRNEKPDGSLSSTS